MLMLMLMPMLLFASSGLVVAVVDAQQLVGTSYCTWAPEYDCYESGWPPCCGGGDENGEVEECPEGERPGCSTLVVVSNSTGIPGSSYCTFAPNTKCYVTGWPDCCSNTTIVCPEKQPDCEENEEPSVDGSSYCTFAPDTDCYLTGWPACCSDTDSNITCPEEQPSCDVGQVVGGSYCTFAPDIDCYATGWPACCSDDNVTCPEERPGCEIENTNNATSNATPSPDTTASPTPAPTSGDGTSIYYHGSISQMIIVASVMVAITFIVV